MHSYHPQAALFIEDTNLQTIFSGLDLESGVEDFNERDLQGLYLDTMIPLDPEIMMYWMGISSVCLSLGSGIVYSLMNDGPNDVY